jgi:hypothetical protein
MPEDQDESRAAGCAAIVIIVLLIIAFIYSAIHHWRW